MQKRAYGIILLTLLAVSILHYPARALDSAADMQCGTEIVSVGDTQFDVRVKCGEPTRITPGSGAGFEQWTYNFGPTEFFYYLTFAEGSLEKIEVGGYGE
ncbi:MAG: DUF2845 domain-containing protein [Desulfobacterales bacterium]|nr:MAG: DUF2845 domain-containing protein [Desulfobacterales bacterium]